MTCTFAVKHPVCKRLFLKDEFTDLYLTEIVTGVWIRRCNLDYWPLDLCKLISQFNKPVFIFDNMRKLSNFSFENKNNFSLIHFKHNNSFVNKSNSIFCSKSILLDR